MKRHPVLFKVKGRMAEKGETLNKEKKKTGISVHSLSDKINGKSLFNTKEIEKVCGVLDISAEEISIFFAISVA